MKCLGCSAQMLKGIKDRICDNCYSNEAKILADLTEKYGDKRAHLLFMGYPETILELDEKLIDYTYDVMMENLKNELG